MLSRERQLVRQVADLERQRDDAYASLQQSGVRARTQRNDVARLQDTVEGLAAGLSNLQQRAVNPDGDPADVLARLAEDAARVLTVTMAHEGAPRKDDDE